MSASESGTAKSTQCARERIAGARQRGPTPSSTLRHSQTETHVELLTRSKYLLCKSYDKMSESQKRRAKILFEEYPKIREVSWIINDLIAVFRTNDIDKETAKAKSLEWNKKVAECSSRELKAARDTIKSRQDEVLNYFVNRATNASAESLNSKLKGFRSQLREVSDLQFYMYRVRTFLIRHQPRTFACVPLFFLLDIALSLRVA